jgi:hypothetical protein
MEIAKLLDQDGGDVMKAWRSIGLVLIGVAIGALLTTATTASQRVHQEPPGGRLFFIDAEQNSAASSLTFIKENKTGACWLGIDTRGQGITALASAPNASCQPHP